MIDDIINRVESIQSYPDICFNCRYLITNPHQVCSKFSTEDAQFTTSCDYLNTLSRNFVYTSSTLTTTY